MPEVGGEFVVDGAHIWAEAARKGETLKVRIEGAAALLRLVIDTGHETSSSRTRGRTCCRRNISKEGHEARD
jgi:hypothetical protein